MASTRLIYGIFFLFQVIFIYKYIMIKLPK